MTCELVDLGKQLVVNCEGNCWVSSSGQGQVSFRGNVNSIRKTLVEALAALDRG